MDTGIGISRFYHQGIQTIVEKDSLIYVGGMLGYIGNLTLPTSTAVWNGLAWNAIDLRVSSQSSSAAFAKIVACDNKNIVICGQFDTANGIAAKCIVKKEGQSWRSLGTYSGLPIDQIETAYQVDNALCIGGPFTFFFDKDTVRGTALWKNDKWNSIGKIGTMDINGFVQGRMGEMIVSAPGLYYSLDSVVVPGGLVLINGSSIRAFTDSTQFGVCDQIDSMETDGKNIFIKIRSGSRTGLVNNPTSAAQWDGEKWIYPQKIHAFDIQAINENGDTAKVIIADQRYQLSIWKNAQWQRLMTPYPDTPVYHIKSLAFDHDTLYACFSYYHQDGNIDAIFKWNGQIWQNLNDQAPFQVSLNDTSAGQIGIIKYYHGSLYVGGTFSNIGSVKASNIARWDGSTWLPLGLGVSLLPPYTFGEDPLVRSIDFYGDDVFVGGYFTFAGDSAIFFVARWDGAAWHGMGSGITYGPGQFGVTGLCVLANRLYIAGQFNRAGGKIAHNFTYYTLPSLSSVSGARETTNNLLLSIFPDPASTFIKISLNFHHEKVLKAEIIDELGNTVKSIDLKNPDIINFQFDIQDLQSGIYFARVFMTNGIANRKFIISK